MAKNRKITESDKDKMFTLRYKDKLKLKEIARIIGCDPHTVRYWLGAKPVMLAYDHKYYQEHYTPGCPLRRIRLLKAEIKHNKERIKIFESELKKLEPTEGEEENEK